MKQRFVCSLMRKGLPISAAIVLLHPSWSFNHNYQGRLLPQSRNRAEFNVWRGSTASCRRLSREEHNVTEKKQRTYNTPVDEYYNANQRLPLPQTVHRVLEIPSTKSKSKGILVIGDVHGCYEELLELHEKAKQENDGMDFEHVICVGDLVNKGPYSTRVMHHVQRSGWLSVRGNHDNAALAAALGDLRRQGKKSYKWVLPTPEKSEQDLFSDDDVVWMSELPYTIRIPGAMLGEENDTVIVHAGFVPEEELGEQSIETMVNIREVPTSGSISGGASQRRPWASVWKGPDHVVFGHDARRGLQLCEYATGLDTGACYGNKLTGLILPGRKVVQVDAKIMYCRPGVKEE